MKTQTNNTHTLGISAFLLVSTVLFISCNGCRSGKVSDIETALPSVKQDNIPIPDSSGSYSTIGKSSTSIYPIINEKKGITYLDENTIEFRGIKRVINGTETKVIFPNGKVLSNIKDAAIWKDIPKRAQLYYFSIEGEEYYKEVDIRKLSKAQKTEWFGKIKLHPDIKQSDLEYMVLHSYFIELDETPGRVCLATYAAVWTENGNTLAGHIAHLDIYDYEGKLILQIPMYEEGSKRFAVTKDQKYLLANINGSSLGDNDFTCGLINPMINIYTFEDGKFYDQVKMACIDYSGSTDDDYFYFGTSSYKWKLNIKRKLIYVIKYSDEIRSNLDKFIDEGILTKDGRLWKYQTYTFDEWNEKDLSIFEDTRFK